MPFVQKVKIIKDKLDDIDETEVAMFFDVGHIANEINSLNKLFYWSTYGENEIEPHHQCNTTYLCMFIRLLSGKLNEANEYIKKHMNSKPELRQYIGQFSEKAVAAKKEINKYFSRTNPINSLRNNQSFHYGNDLIGNHNEKLDDEFVLYLSEDDGNSLYYHSEVVKLMKMMELISSDDVKWDKVGLHKIFDSLIKDVTRLTHLFMVTLTEIMIVFTDKHNDAFIFEKDQLLVDRNVISLKEFKLPWFYYRDEKPSRSKEHE